jgi:WhiB family redox-sensing transcriptional regulator
VGDGRLHGDAVTRPGPDPDEWGARMAWRQRANCVGIDPDLFFPGRGSTTRDAKEVCRGCVVRDECLAYAMTARERFGIWGGLSERERRRLRHALAQPA